MRELHKAAVFTQLATWQVCHEPLHGRTIAKILKWHEATFLAKVSVMKDGARKRCGASTSAPN